MDPNKLQAEIDTYVSRTPKSAQLQKQAEAYLPGGSSRGTSYFDPYPHFVERGEGPYIIDVDGNKSLDFMINATSLILGHADPSIAEVISDQAGKGAAFSGPTTSQIRLANILASRIPSVDTIRFTNSGTEGTMMAVRAARQFTGREKILKIEGGYHGSHDYVSISVYPAKDDLNPEGPTPVPEYSTQPSAIADGVFVVAYNDSLAAEAVIRENADEIACVIMEPIISSIGYVPADISFLEKMRELTKELDIVLIFDEVQSLRVSPGGAQELFGVIPDMTTLGKIIGGGTPVGAFGGRRDIMSAFDPTDGGADLAHAGTFNANPITMRAGEVVMNALTVDEYERMNALGQILREKLRAVFAEMDVSVTITGVASLFGIHFTDGEVKNYRDAISADSQMKKAFFLGMLNEGVLLMAGAAGALNVLSTDDHVDELVDSARRVIQRIR